MIKQIRSAKHEQKQKNKREASIRQKENIFHPAQRQQNEEKLQAFPVLFFFFAPLCAHLQHAINQNQRIDGARIKQKNEEFVHLWVRGTSDRRRNTIKHNFLIVLSLSLLLQMDKNDYDNCVSSHLSIHNQNEEEEKMLQPFLHGNSPWLLSRVPWLGTNELWNTRTFNRHVIDSNFSWISTHSQQ